MEIILNFYETQRIISSTVDEQITDKINEASLVGEFKKLSFTRKELMTIIYSIIPTEIKGDSQLSHKLCQAIDNLTSFQINDKVRIKGSRGQMPPGSYGTLMKIIEVDIDHRNFEVVFEGTDYSRFYRAYELEKE